MGIVRTGLVAHRHPRQRLRVDDQPFGVERLVNLEVREDHALSRRLLVRPRLEFTRVYRNEGTVLESLFWQLDEHMVVFAVEYADPEPTFGAVLKRPAAVIDGLFGSEQGPDGTVALPALDAEFVVEHARGDAAAQPGDLFSVSGHDVFLQVAAEACRSPPSVDPVYASL